MSYAAQGMMRPSDALREVAGREWQGEWERETCLHIASDLEDMESKFYKYRTLGTIEELTELIKAKRDGRCVVLPCKKEHYLPEEWFYIMQNCVWSVKAVDAMRPVFKHGIRKFYSTPEEAEAALAKEDNDERD